MASSYNVQSEEEIARINKIRQAKILKKILDKDTSVLIDDPLENDMVLNMGPQHPATHGVLRALLRLDGETILKVEPELGYLHRGMEKIAENVIYHDFIPFTDRLDYMCPLANNAAYTYAVENALGIEAPERAQWIRVLISEIARVSSHLMAMGSTCNDLGAVTMLLWTFTEREKLYDIIELICGARFTSSYTRIGGVANDIDENAIQHIRAWATDFPRQLKDCEGLVNRNRIFLDRVSGVGILTAEQAISLGITGSTLRGSGVARDLRRDLPYWAYDKLDFNVITYPECDVWARYMVRLDEMKESCKIILQVIDKMPKGDIILRDPKTVLPRKRLVYTQMEDLIDDFMLINKGCCPPKGETYTAVESAKGEFGFFIVSDGTGHPWKMKIRSPSSANLQSLKPMAEGSMISDIVVCIGSIDPIMGEADK